MLGRDNINDIGKLTNEVNDEENTSNKYYSCNTWKNEAITFSAGCLLGLLSLPLYIVISSIFLPVHYLGDYTKNLKG